jgi:hypothetical protein
MADDEVSDEEGGADEQEDEDGPAIWGFPELPGTEQSCESA